MSDTPSSVNELIAIVKKYGFEYFGVFYGSYRGFVVNNQDPKGLGRVQVRAPQIAGDNKVNYWAWPKGQSTGEDFGDFMIPPKGSPVWVEFENGDPQHPIYTGGHWGKKTQKVPTSSGGNPKKRTRSSEKWEFEMDDDGDTIKLSSKAGGHKIQIDGAGNIAVQGGGNIAQTTGGNETKNIDGNSGTEVSGNKSITCVNFGLTATGDCTMNLNGVNIAITSGQLAVSVGGSSFVINAGGVTIMGKDFLTHVHTGVDPGGGVTGGVS